MFLPSNEWGDRLETHNESISPGIIAPIALTRVVVDIQLIPPAPIAHEGDRVVDPLVPITPFGGRIAH